MEIDPFLHLHREARDLEVGSEVVVYWSDQGYSYRSKGKVVRLGSKNVDVELFSAIEGSREHPRVRYVTVPLLSNTTAWHSGRCVRPGKSPGSLP